MKIKYIIIHCTATPEGREVTAAEVDRWHRKRGFKQIGYHYLIRLDGTIEKGRPERMIGAHTLGQNATSIGVCYVGGVGQDGVTPRDTRTPAQRRALEGLVRELLGRYPGATVRGHRDFAAKACPSFDATAEFKRFLSVALLAVSVAFGLVSCRSENHAVKAENIAVADQRTIETGRKVSSAGFDSIVLELENPVIEYVRQDSTKVVVSATRVAAGRVRTIRTTVRDTMCFRDTVYLEKSMKSENVQKQQPLRTGLTERVLVLTVGLILVYGVIKWLFRK